MHIDFVLMKRVVHLIQITPFKGVSSFNQYTIIIEFSHILTFVNIQQQTLLVTSSLIILLSILIHLLTKSSTSKYFLIKEEYLGLYYC